MVLPLRIEEEAGWIDRYSGSVRVNAIKGASSQDSSSYIRNVLRGEIVSFELSLCWLFLSFLCCVIYNIYAVENICYHAKRRGLGRDLCVM